MLRPTRKTILGALVVVLPLVVWALYRWADLLHPDSTRALLMARDCAEADLCQPNGVPASVPGMSQGALWTQLLAVAWRLGLPPAAMGLGVLSLVALGTALLAKLTAPRVGWAILAAMYLAIPDVLVEPTVQLAFSLLATGVALVWWRRPTWSVAILTGLCWGLTADLHVAGWVAVLAGAVAGVVRGPRLHVLLASAVAVTVSVALSPQMWAGFLRPHPLVPPQWALRYALPLLPTVAVWAHGRWSTRGVVPGRLGLLARPGFWMGAAILMATLTYKPAQRHSYSYAREVAAIAWAHGVGWPEALTAVRGEHAGDVAESVGLYLPQTPALPTGHVMTLTAGHVARAIASRVDIARATLCPDLGPCSPLHWDPTPHRLLYPFAARAWPRVVDLPESATRVTLHLPLLAGTARHFAIAGPRGDPEAWAFANGGAQFGAQTNTAELSLVRSRQGGHWRDTRFLPPLLEEGPPAEQQAPVWGRTPQVEPATDARPFAAAVLAALVAAVAWVLGAWLILRNGPGQVGGQSRLGVPSAPPYTDAPPRKASPKETSR